MGTGSHRGNRTVSRITCGQWASGVFYFCSAGVHGESFFVVCCISRQDLVSDLNVEFRSVGPS